MDLLFPTPVYWHTPTQFETAARACIQEFQQAKSHIAQSLSEHNPEPGYVRITDEFSQDDACATYNLPQLQAYIDHHVQQYAQQCGYSLTARLDHSWFHRVPPGHGHAWHSHGNAHISGTVYLENSSSGDIVFRSGNGFARAGQFPSRGAATPVVNRTPQDGDIGCWPGWMEHSVTTNNSSEDRWAVSFDYNLTAAER